MVGSHRQYRLQGWVVSTFVHGLALTVTFGLMAQVKPVVPQDTFKWDVALVEPQRIHETSQDEIKPAQEPAKPTPHPATPPPSHPKKITRQVQPREVKPVAQHEMRQAVETSEPIQQMVAVQTEPVTPVMDQPLSEVQQTEQSLHEAVPPLVQQEAATHSVMTEAPVQPVIETTPAPQESSLQASPAADPSDAKPAESVERASPPQMAMATRPTSVVKADYGWLAESLGRRLAEIKRYPSTARLNGWEGKVVLRAVIRADGHLSDVRVHRSSGHETLDNAALEAIRLVCPLHMHHPLGTSEVAIYVPMVYSLRS